MKRLEPQMPLVISVREDLFHQSRLIIFNSGPTRLREQLVQNAVAQLLNRKRRCDHIPPVLSSLHWFPVSFKIKFKFLLFVFKTLNGLAPSFCLSCCTNMFKPWHWGQQVLGSKLEVTEPLHCSHCFLPCWQAATVKDFMTLQNHCR